MSRFDQRARVVTAVVSCQARKGHQEAIRRTFFSLLPSPVFVVGHDGECGMEGDTVRLQCSDVYEGLPQKMWKFYQWLLGVSDFEYVLKVDDDCVVHLEALDACLGEVWAAKERPDYLGGAINEPTTGNDLDRDWHRGKVSDRGLDVRYEGAFAYAYCQGGCGVLLSRRAVELIVKEGREAFFNPMEFYEDKLHGDVLGARGIVPQKLGRQVVTTNLPPVAMAAEHEARNGRGGGGVAVVGARRLALERAEAFGSFFFACHWRRFLFLSVSKCGCSTVKQQIFREEVGAEFQGADLAVHDVFGYAHRESSVMALGNRRAWEPFAEQGYVRFAVWRDPVERLLSTYREKVLNTQSGAPFFQQCRGMSLDEFIELTGRVVAEVSPEKMDEHLRPQSACYEAANVDWIVPLERLDEFLWERFGLEPIQRANTTNAQLTQGVTKAQRARIAEIYARDGLIRANWPPQWISTSISRPSTP